MLLSKHVCTFSQIRDILLKHDNIAIWEKTHVNMICRSVKAEFRLFDGRLRWVRLYNGLLLQPSYKLSFVKLAHTTEK